MPLSSRSMWPSVPALAKRDTSSLQSTYIALIVHHSRNTHRCLTTARDPLGGLIRGGDSKPWTTFATFLWSIPRRVPAGRIAGDRSVLDCCCWCNMSLVDDRLFDSYQLLVNPASGPELVPILMVRSVASLVSCEREDPGEIRMELVQKIYVSRSRL